MRRFERRGFTLRGTRLLKISRQLAAQHYAEHKGEPFYGDLVAFITSGPTMALAVEGESAVSVVRTMMGATNPLDSAPGTIRGDYATSSPTTSCTGRTRRPARSASSRCSSPMGRLSGAARERNREVWMQAAKDYVAAGERAWATDEIDWGIYGVKEADLRAADVELNGADIVELGCGTAYFSAWFARRGARPVGVDVTPAQLETARRLQREHGLEFPLLEASAEDVPLPDAAFDLGSEYGASNWCDPYRWVPEAARLLRPAGG